MNFEFDIFKLAIHLLVCYTNKNANTFQLVLTRECIVSGSVYIQEGSTGVSCGFMIYTKQRIDMLMQLCDYSISRLLTFEN